MLWAFCLAFCAGYHEGCKFGLETGCELLIRYKEFLIAMNPDNEEEMYEFLKNYDIFTLIAGLEMLFEAISMLII